MNRLTVAVRIQLIVFAVLAFSVYYILYFTSFSQGDSIDGGVEINLVKVFSILFLVSAFYKYRIKLNYFDLQYLFFVAFSAMSYVIAGIIYGFNDKLFLNFLLFSLCYILLVSEGAERKIFYSYDVICFIVLVQIFIDVFLRLAHITLWDGGLYVGGLGNPTSFGFICTFCLAYVLLEGAKFSNGSKLFLSIAYMYAVFSTNALFPIFLLAIIFVAAFINTSSFRGKLFLVFSLLLGGLLAFSFIAEFEGSLLENKVNSLFYLVGFREDPAESISVSARIENISLVGSFLQDTGVHLFFGHHQDLTYYPVDSQYITLLLSFGLVVLLYFVFFNFIAMCRIGLNKKHEKRGFIISALLLFFLIFTNNRVLDYFPLGYIYVSLIALISQGKRSRYHASKLSVSLPPSTSDVLR